MFVKELKQMYSGRLYGSDIELRDENNHRDPGVGTRGNFCLIWKVSSCVT